MDRIAVLGAGSWGTAVAALLAAKGHAVALWARDADLADEAESTRHNPRYITELELPDGLSVTADAERALRGAEIAVVAVPAQALGESVAAMKSYLSSDTVFVSLTKGLEIETLRRMSQVLAELGIASRRLAVLSGPNHAEEVARNIPSATVIAAYESEVAHRLQEVFMARHFRVYTNSDVTGVELAGAAKNVIAIAAGISDGLGYGDNTKASLMTRGLAEMTRLGVANGAEPFTFSGLAGIGDLIVTCTSRHSRNRHLGEELGKGHALAEIQARMRMVAEGVGTAKALKQLSEQEGIEIPISREVYRVLYEGKRAYDCVADLMLREPTGETKLAGGKTRSR